jgi:alkylated DNA repair dioxygenase AlkB
VAVTAGSRAAAEEPAGLVYRPGLVTADEEAALLGELAELRFDPVVLHGRAARRTARHFGYAYDYSARTATPGEPPPAWVLPARGRAAALAGVAPEELAQVLVLRYPPGATIGWHRDAAAFGTVVGISLAAPCRLRFQRGTGPARCVWEVLLEPRSGYVLAGAARTSWEHSIPATKALRYSITFRTLHAGREGSGSYERLRADPTHDAVVPGHDCPEVESVVTREPQFNVVRKDEGEPAEIARGAARARRSSRRRGGS